MLFDFTKEYLLEDERVLLIPMKMEDINHLLPFALNEPEIWKYSLIAVEGKEGLQAYINSAINAREAKKEYAFTVFDKKANAYAGSTRFYDILPQHQTLQLGYTWYGSRFQGTGINQHCKFLLLSFAFETMGVQRVEFRANELNKRSIAAMKSIGCTLEGTLRNNLVTPNGGRRSSAILSILKNEWEIEIKNSLKAKLNEIAVND